MTWCSCLSDRPGAKEAIADSREAFTKGWTLESIRGGKSHEENHPLPSQSQG